MNVIFKKCTLNDLTTLIEIGKSTFIAAFEKHNSPENFKSYMNAAFSEEKIKAELINPDSTFMFIFLKNKLIGYVKLNENTAQNEVFDESSIELERIYIVKEFQGNQLGQQTLLEVIKIARQKNVAFVWLGVWEHNHAAIRFYKRHGFQKFGTHPYALGNDIQTDWLMRYILI